MNPDVPSSPFIGYVETTVNALRLINAARQGVIPRLTRRLSDSERRTMIKSGAVFVFCVQESQIKRWTDGLLWSPSRIVGNFLVYREINERTKKISTRGHKKPYPHDDSPTRSLTGKSSQDQALSNWRGDQGTFKIGGLIKKTIVVIVQESNEEPTHIHLISYFTPDDIRSGKLKRPSTRADIMSLYMPPHIFRLTTFRDPPKVEIGSDGKPRLVETEDLEYVEDSSWYISPTWPSQGSSRHGSASSSVHSNQGSPNEKWPGPGSNDINNDKSEHSWVTTCWIAAESALQHARNNISSVSKVFEKWQIQKPEYIVLAGFDESLIKSSIGYLEQIHVFVIAEVDATSSLLTDLGRLFSPFSSILFTESSSYRLPVFKDDGSIWEFDELVYFTASKFPDSGSSAKTPFTIISLTQTPSQADGMTGFSQPEGSSGSGEGEKNKTLKKGDERDMDDIDEADRDDKDPSDNPNDPPEDQDKLIASRAIKITVNTEMYRVQEERHMGPLQTLTMNGSLTIETMPENPHQYSERFVQFTGLSFSTKLQTENAFKQIHLRVFVDSREPNACALIPNIKPKTTPGSDREEIQSSSTKSGRTLGGAGSVTVGLNTQGTLTVTSTKTKEETVTTEKKRYNSPITELDEYGKIWWDYLISDDRYQKLGYPMPEDVLPTVRFRFYGESEEPRSPSPHMDIAITSHWSKISQSELPEKGTGIHKLLHLFRSNGNAQTISESYSNLFQIVAFTADVPNLSMDTYYPALVKIDLDSGISEPIRTYDLMQNHSKQSRI